MPFPRVKSWIARYPRLRTFLRSVKASLLGTGARTALRGNQTVDRLDFRMTYRNHVQTLLRAHPNETALHLAVGGAFEIVGALERDVLIHHGLKPQDYLIDVGCGSGRLAKFLSPYLSGRYLGIDVVRELIDHARVISNRTDWKFVMGEGLTIPERDNRADMVCFFSVLTHLLHEQSYVYLNEARRVLKPKGRVVFSFLEFAQASHWNIFESDIAAIGTHTPLNVFIERTAIAAWANHLGMTVEAIYNAEIPLTQPIHAADGSIALKERGNLGQSICVLVKG